MILISKQQQTLRITVIRFVNCTLVYIKYCSIPAMYKMYVYSGISLKLAYTCLDFLQYFLFLGVAC